MKRHILEFVKRGLMCAAGGPLILAIIYGVLGQTGDATVLAPQEVCIGILTVTLIAFIAAGITTVYQIERLPLICAILIHGGVLYLDYLLMYLVNSWIPRNWEGIGMFTVIFLAGYAITWVIIYLCIKAKTDRINQQLHH